MVAHVPSIEVVRGDALAWIKEHDPRGFAVLAIDPPYGRQARNGAVPRGKFDGVSIEGDSDTARRDAVLDWWDVDLRPAAVFGERTIPHYERPRGVLTWDKLGAAGMGDVSFPWKPDNTEEIAVYGPGWEGPRDSSVLRFCPVRGQDGKTHPHEKPVALWMHILAKAPRGRVLDTFGGTGSVAEAAHRLGRGCTIIEIDPRWWPTLQERIDRLTAQTSMWGELG